MQCGTRQNTFGGFSANWAFWICDRSLWLAVQTSAQEEKMKVMVSLLGMTNTDYCHLLVWRVISSQASALAIILAVFSSTIFWLRCKRVSSLLVLCCQFGVSMIDIIGRYLQSNLYICSTRGPFFLSACLKRLRDLLLRPE